MDKYEIRRMLENKQAYVASLGVILREFDQARSGVESITLKVEQDSWDGYEEEIQIKLVGGTTIRIPATGNSNIANMMAIGKALQ